MLAFDFLIGILELEPGPRLMQCIHLHQRRWRWLPTGEGAKHSFTSGEDGVGFRLAEGWKKGRVN